eukprot:Plantae.Rhodophyta-Purpureofilum_apyrenoidigerum.ctg8916.p1 GENE.Plantae.Rhodophyta-Purpureofilum_apyrenoidigerum.ctg8916~~Plantae.Rhodophyta-Purpureofilum_apyrenoidigerum.ctg8916.p1  ORF type:complete len:302 (-),score=57.64 Plantae.Rhodophyta-Purpureofilum_apyrenoidigerum.ctg8916:649-1434(-)
MDSLGFVAGVGVKWPARVGASCSRLECTRAARVRMTHDEAGGNEMTVADAVKEWQTAKEKGQVPAESPEVPVPKKSKFRVLFVCRDNITTSVVAEAILRDLLRRRRFEQYVEVDSAGYRANDGHKPPQEFATALSFRRKLDISDHTARKLLPADIDSYHLIICMDSRTKNNVLYMKVGNPGQGKDESQEKALTKKIRMLADYCTVAKLRKMEFPSGEYRQGAMRIMLSAVVDGCNGLLAKLSKGVEKTQQMENNSGKPSAE